MGKTDVKFNADLTLRINGLFQGGYLINLFDNNQETIEGIILDNNGKYNCNWGFPPNLNVSNFYAAAAFRNNTQLLITEEDEMSWKILSTTLPTFFPNGKHNISCYSALYINNSA